jgi:hypothetical protein
MMSASERNVITKYTCRNLCNAFLCNEGNLTTITNFKALQKLIDVGLRNLTGVNNNLNRKKYNDMSQSEKHKAEDLKSTTPRKYMKFGNKYCICTKMKQISPMVSNLIRFHLKSIEIYCNFLCNITEELEIVQEDGKSRLPLNDFRLKLDSNK